MVKAIPITSGVVDRVEQFGKKERNKPFFSNYLHYSSSEMLFISFNLHLPIQNAKYWKLYNLLVQYLPPLALSTGSSKFEKKATDESLFSQFDQLRSTYCYTFYTSSVQRGHGYTQDGFSTDLRSGQRQSYGVGLRSRLPSSLNHNVCSTRLRTML